MNVVKASVDKHTEDYWTAKTIDACDFRLLVYTVDKQRSNQQPTWRDVTLPKQTDAPYTWFSGMAYDSHGDMFVAVGKAVLVYFLSGQFDHELLVVRDRIVS